MQLFAALLLFIVNSSASVASPVAEKFAVSNVVSSVALSPDGKFLALIRTQPRTDSTVLEVYETKDLTRKPFRMSHDPMRILDLTWVSDGTILLGFFKLTPGLGSLAFSTGMSVVDVKRQSLTLIPEDSPILSSYWPTSNFRVVLSFPKVDPDYRMAVTPSLPLPENVFSMRRNTAGIYTTSKSAISGWPYSTSQFSAPGISESFVPRDYFDLNLRTNKKRRLLETGVTLAQVEVDGNGKPWLARGLDAEQSDYVWYVPNSEDDGWKETHRQDTDSLDPFRVQGFDGNNRNILFVTAKNGAANVGLWEYYADRASFGELIYQRPDTDVLGVRHHSNSWANPDDVVGVTYYTDREHVEFFDSDEAALLRKLAAAIPASFNLSITSQTKDGKMLTVHNVGPQDPGSYYLVKGGALELLGSSNPLLRSEDLAPMQYLSYASADGMTTHAFVTARKAAKPLPTVVLVRDTASGHEVVDYDALAQLLVSRGYLVIQPELRRKQAAADVVSGIEYLVAKGLAEPERVALFEWTDGESLVAETTSSATQRFRCVLQVSSADSATSKATVTSGEGRKVISLGAPGLPFGAKMFGDVSQFYNSIIEYLEKDCGPGGL